MADLFRSRYLNSLTKTVFKTLKSYGCKGGNPLKNEELLDDKKNKMLKTNIQLFQRKQVTTRIHPA